MPSDRSSEQRFASRVRGSVGRSGRLIGTACESIRGKRGAALAGDGRTPRREGREGCLSRRDEVMMTMRLHVMSFRSSERTVSVVIPSTSYLRALTRDHGRRLALRRACQRVTGWPEGRTNPTATADPRIGHGTPAEPDHGRDTDPSAPRSPGWRVTVSSRTARTGRNDRRRLAHRTSMAQGPARAAEPRGVCRADHCGASLGASLRRTSCCYPLSGRPRSD